MLSNQWAVRDCDPVNYLPTGVRLTAYSGGSADLPAEALQSCLDRLAGGTASLGPVRVLQLDDIRAAHLGLEHNRSFGKHVVLTHADDQADRAISSS